ncbi:MAG: methyltransferase domain-containing protein [Chitinivibrionales bacterium]
MMTFNLNHFIPDLSHRAESLELMDDAAADESMLFTTLRDFKYINRFLSQIRRVLRKTVFADIRRRRAREVSFLDVAAGGCDTAVWFTRQCRRLGIKCSVYCLDKDPRALRYAKVACQGEQSIRFLLADARDISRLNLSVDYAFTNHFIHHLSDNDIPPMLRAIHGCCKHGFVVHDLERLVAWYFGYSFIGGMFWREGFTRQDGCLSIRRGFRRAELEGYIERAGIDGIISRSGLGHWLITNIHT